MKKLLFSLSIAMLAVGVQAQNVYEQPFNDGVQPEDWTAEVEGPGTWIFDSDTTPGGVAETNSVDPFDSLAAIFDDDSNPSGSAPSKATLSSPVFPDFADAGTETTLEFEYACNFYPTDNGGRFYVEVFDGETWVEVLNATSMVQPTVFSLSVAEFLNEEFQVRFVFDDEGNWSWGAGVNYFKLTQETMAAQDLIKNSFSIYPNPVKDIAYLKSSQAVKQLSVYDMTGKELVMQKNVSSVNLNQLPAGVYVVKVVLADGAVINQKLVKK